MADSAKSLQLQIRVSAPEKAAIQRAARRAGLDMSQYVLARILDEPQKQFQQAVVAVTQAGSRFALAELNSLLATLMPGELRGAVQLPPAIALSDFHANYVAALVETACARHNLAWPDWLSRVTPLVEPAFGSSLQSLRLYLLAHSPAAFRRRNIFIDSTLGDRV
jgi:uncharacterized protein (DUF1778 family)